jgi:hypothetical protein
MSLKECFGFENSPQALARPTAGALSAKIGSEEHAWRLGNASGAPERLEKTQVVIRKRFIVLLRPLVMPTARAKSGSTTQAAWPRLPV